MLDALIAVQVLSELKMPTYPFNVPTTHRNVRFLSEIKRNRKNIILHVLSYRLKKDKELLIRRIIDVLKDMSWVLFHWKLSHLCMVQSLNTPCVYHVVIVVSYSFAGRCVWHAAFKIKEISTAVDAENLHLRNQNVHLVIHFKKSS